MITRHAAHGTRANRFVGLPTVAVPPRDTIA